MPVSHQSFSDVASWFEDAEDKDCDKHDTETPLHSSRSNEVFVGGVVVIFTDGACRNNQDARFRRAGYGAYLSDGNPLNVSAPLTGWAQTNNRAELMAVIAAVGADSRTMEIRSDSKYVVNGIHRGFARQQATGWRGVHNADLWQLLDAALAARAHDSFRIVKVRGHVLQLHVQKGLATQEDRLGNNAADDLATKGADRHKADPKELQDARCKRALAISVQHMMVEILAARTQASQLLAVPSREDSSSTVPALAQAVLSILMTAVMTMLSSSPMTSTSCSHGRLLHLLRVLTRRALHGLSLALRAVREP
ncbi:unnamed protein product [Polarella glacialis]|uniref:ribonuclease H n=1 Tax=Polarella glacialis TaxID=89957 RepID=A0A813EW83_POLGL|nr:unnamed protein product [Polarella glacialis]